MTVYKVLHTQEITFTDYVYQEKKGGKELVNIEECVDASLQSLEEYIKKSKVGLNAAVINSNRTGKISKKSSKNKKMRRNTTVLIIQAKN